MGQQGTAFSWVKTGISRGLDSAGSEQRSAVDWIELVQKESAVGWIQLALNGPVVNPVNTVTALWIPAA
jgi:hypothetical protein